MSERSNTIKANKKVKTFVPVKNILIALAVFERLITHHFVLTVIWKSPITDSL